MKSHNTSRRNFLRGIAVAGASVAGASFLGACSPRNRAEDVSQSSDSESSSTSDRVPGYCGPGDWLGEPPQIDDSQISETIDADMVIVGNGHAGVGAAFSAVDEGMTVSVIEEQPWSAYVNDTGDGTNMAGWYGEDIGHVNSQFLINRGFGPYNTGDITEEFCKRAAGRVNPDIIRTFVQNSGAMFDRYKAIYDSFADERKQNDSAVYMTKPIDGQPDGTYDMSNMFDYPLCNTQKCHDDVSYPVEASGYKTWPCNAQFYGHQGNNIEFVHKYIVEYAQQHGATYYFEHTAKVLTQNENGDVTGVIAQDTDGNYKKFTAKKGVLLAAGDFIGNPQMCWALLNEGMEWGERSGSTEDDWVQTGFRTGDGQKMGCWAGGMIEPSPRGWMALGGGAAGPWGSAPLLQLNANGERYYNEAAICQSHSINLRQPEGIMSWVTDANWQQTIGQAPLDHGAPNFGMDDFWTDLVNDMNNCKPGPDPNSVVGANLAERKMMQGQVYCANTLSDLADYLGYEGDAKQNFLQSIQHYNDLCNSADGDTDYGKDKKYMVPIDTPPFYGGVSNAPNSHKDAPMMVTLSGLITDKNQNVLDHDWQPIKGLYAAGNCLGGRYGMGYTTPFAGNSIGMAITHGYTAAKIIAQQ